MPVPDPEPAPAPDPAPVPDPAAPAPAPIPVTISIVGSVGPGAFLPNPTSAVVGDTVVFTNSDLRIHRIVLDDGTVLPNLAPGQSTDPIALTRMTTAFYCEIHPSMTGSIQDPSAPPIESPPYQPPAPPDYKPDDDYGDDYY